MRSLLAAQFFAGRAEKADQGREAQERAVVVARNLDDQIPVVQPSPVVGDFDTHLDGWRLDQGASRSLGYRRPHRRTDAGTVFPHASTLRVSRPERAVKPGPSARKVVTLFPPF